MSGLHGLVIGKFYPPHAGHELLVRTAASQCARVSVIAMAASHESIPLARRVEWLREMFADLPCVEVVGVVDDVPVDYESDTAWALHVELMRQALASSGAPAVDAVFTSEPYGAELARRLGARPVELDRARSLAPISATRVRADVPGHWDFLSAPVRAGLAFQVVVLGAESTGTTTLARDLADALRARGGADGLTRWVPEYGREYSVAKMARAVAAAQLAGEPPPDFDKLVWQSDEFAHIASVQNDWQRQAARLGGPVLVCDTDAFATTVWHERYLGSRDARTEDLAEAMRAPLYLLTHHEGVAFEQDGIRDGEHLRAWMTERFEARLRETGRTHRTLRGSREARKQKALEALDQMKKSAWQFAQPLG